MKVLGIIPARGGSKGVPRKNLRKFHGKPLLAYAIETGRESLSISHLVVNTEDPEIIQTAEEYDCEVVRRGPQIARDDSAVIDTVFQTLNFFDSKNEYFDAVLLLQPTAPLRTGKDIDRAVELLESSPNLDAVISMVQVDDHHPARMYRISNNRLHSLMPEYESERRQKLPPLFLRNGCIYLVRTNAIRKYKTLMPENKAPYIMDAQWFVNIDTEIDVIILDELLKKWKRGQR